MKLITLFVGAILLLSLSGVSAQDKSDFGLLRKGEERIGFTRLELATSLGMTGIRQSNNPIFHYSIFDTVIADTNIHSSIAPSPLYFDSTVADTSVVMVKQKSALAAVVLSVIPGGGQIYNGSYWKVPIIYGLQGFFIYEWIQNNNSYKSFRTQLQDSIDAGASAFIVGELQGVRDAYHDQRDSYAWYMAGVYVLSILDAYIDAELSGFDVSPSLGLAPDGSTTAAICVRVKF